MAHTHAPAPAPNPSGRQTPMRAQEFPLGFATAMAAIAALGRTTLGVTDREGTAKSLAKRFRRYVAALRDEPGHPHHRLAADRSHRFVVTIDHTLLGYVVQVHRVAVPPTPSQVLDAAFPQELPVRG